jgi:RimJ/RimL family protein N-acetyltransferase
VAGQEPEVNGPVIETARLRLRPPREADFEPMCVLYADETAARFIGGVKEPAVVWRMLAQIMGHWAMRGWGFFAIEERASGAYAGWAGPWFPHGWPAPEVGWSLLPAFQGRGYATEAAAAAIDHAFDALGWDRVVHLIDADNDPSKAVARRLGSSDTGQDAEIAGFGVIVDVWGQSRADWRARSGGTV